MVFIQVYLKMDNKIDCNLMSKMQNSFINFNDEQNL